MSADIAGGGRVGPAPQTVCHAVRYLLETEAVTGECLTVDGGEQHGHVRERFTDTATDRDAAGPNR